MLTSGLSWLALELLVQYGVQSVHLLIPTVRGTSPRPPTCPRLVPHAPVVRPADPPDVPPNLRPATNPRRW